MFSDNFVVWHLNNKLSHKKQSWFWIETVFKIFQFKSGNGNKALLSGVRLFGVVTPGDVWFIFNIEND